MEVQEGLTVAGASTTRGVPVAPGLRAVLETGAGPEGRAGAGLAAQLLTVLRRIWADLANTLPYIVLRHSSCN